MIDLAKLRLDDLDPRVRIPGHPAPRRGRGVIVNIDYPLGMAAYRVLREVLENLTTVRGIYILGKAATLNGSIGDVMISNVVLDEHSENTYWLDNCFTAADVTCNLVFGAVLDNQKAVANKGTFLQNRAYLDFYYRANYSVVEMEAGPVPGRCLRESLHDAPPHRRELNFAVPVRPRHHPLRLGHPYTRGKNPGAGRLPTRHGLHLRLHHRHREAHPRIGAGRRARRRRRGSRRGAAPPAQPRPQRAQLPVERQPIRSTYSEQEKSSPQLPDGTSPKS